MNSVPAQATPAENLAGLVLGQRYRLVRLLGSGGMGAVYEARQMDLERSVAVKVVRRQLDAHALARFRREAETTARLGHPHIVTVIDFLASPVEPPAIVMELLQGTSMAAEIARVQRLAPGRAAAVAAQVLSALAAAHEAGVVHRDMKPQNVFLVAGGPSDFVKVLDFGIAKVDAESPLSAIGHVVGTPSYMAPEQVTGGAIDARTDVYGVGALLYAMLTGRPPTDTRGGDLAPVVTTMPEPVQQIEPTVPRELADIVHRALEKEPWARFQSAREMADALLRLAPVAPARPVPSGEMPSTVSAPQPVVNAHASTATGGPPPARPPPPPHAPLLANANASANPTGGGTLASPVYMTVARGPAPPAPKWPIFVALGALFLLAGGGAAALFAVRAMRGSISAGAVSGSVGDTKAASPVLASPAATAPVSASTPSTATAASSVPPTLGTARPAAPGRPSASAPPAPSSSAPRPPPSSSPAAPGGACTQSSECRPDQKCLGNVCTCDKDALLCGGRCVDMRKHPHDHCGSCDRACGPEELCRWGNNANPADWSRDSCKSCIDKARETGKNFHRCVDPTTSEPYNELCRDLDSDLRNCGACNRPCKGVCERGVCRVP